MDGPRKNYTLKLRGKVQRTQPTLRLFSLSTEHLNGLEVTGGAADIYKCSGQLMQALIYELLSKAGLPEKVLKPYIDFQERLKAYNAVAGGIGKPFQKRARSQPNLRANTHSNLQDLA